MADELINLMALPVSSLCCACRLCAAVIDATAAVSIFNRGERYVGLNEKINRYLPIAVDEADPFPKTLCHGCADLLLQFHDLYQKCVLFDEHLRRSLDNCTDDIDVEAELNVSLETNDGEVEFDLEELDFLESRLPAESGNNNHVGGTCQVCGEKLPDFDECLRHQKDHININKRCVVCGVKNFSDLEINLHLAKHFNGGKLPTSEVEQIEVSDKKSLREKCVKCNQELFDAENAVTHCKSHRPTDTSSYSCVFCSERVNVDNLQRHMSTHFTVPSSPLLCDDCQREYPDEKSLKYHRCVRLLKYQCSKCKQKFRTDNRLKFHEEFHVNKKTFCDICNKDFKFESRIYIHMMGAHLGEREAPFCCDKCGRTFRWLKTLQVHQLTHSKDRPFACRKCEARFSRKNSLIAHMSCHETTQRLHCLRCPYTTGRKLRLMHHVDRFHKQFDKSQLLIQCRKCQETFPNKLHAELEHHPHGTEATDFEEIAVNKLYQCERCGSNFASAIQLKTHRGDHANDDPLSTYHCRLCSMSFRKHDLLVRHRRVHLNITSKFTDTFRVLVVNVCDLCGLECVDYTQLINHKERSNCLNNGKKCVKKPLVTSRLRPLKLQDLIINAEGLFECPSCSRTYKSRRRYRLHLATHSL